MIDRGVGTGLRMVSERSVAERLRIVWDVRRGKLLRSAADLGVTSVDKAVGEEDNCGVAVAVGVSVWDGLGVEASIFEG